MNKKAPINKQILKDDNCYQLLLNSEYLCKDNRLNSFNETKLRQAIINIKKVIKLMSDTTR